MPEHNREDVRYEVDGGVARITLNRPDAHNSLSVASIALLAQATREARDDDAVRAVVLTGAGDQAFCTGGDLHELMPRVAGGDGLDLIVPDPTKRFFSDFAKPVIAAVNGLCVGGGFELMLGTDLRIASETATFALAEVRWGHIPGAGSHVRLPAQIPYAIAMQLLLTGDPIDARRAYEVGLVNEVVAPEAVVDRATALAERIAANAPLAVRTAKEIVLRTRGYEPGFALERALNERVAGSADAQEGPRAFTERRKPRYTGR